MITPAYTARPSATTAVGSVHPSESSERKSFLQNLHTYCSRIKEDDRALLCHEEACHNSQRKIRFLEKGGYGPYRLQTAQKELADREVECSQLVRSQRLNGDEVVRYFQSNGLLLQQDPHLLEEALFMVVEANAPLYIDLRSALPTPSEEVQFQLIKKACPRMHDDPVFFARLLHSPFSREQILELFQEIGQVTLSNLLLKELSELHLDPLEQRNLFLHIAQTNPALLYEYWDTLLLSPELKAELQAQIPFFSLQQKINDLYTNSSFDALKIILSELHTLNRTLAIPPRLYLHREAPSLYHYIFQIASQHNDATLDALLKSLPVHFFSGTPYLMEAVLEAIRPRYAALESFFSLILHEVGSFDARLPSLKLDALVHILEDRVQRKYSHIQNAGVYVAACHDLQNSINLFLQEGKQKGAFLVSHEGHYTPLILEKTGDTLSCFVADPLLGHNPSYTQDTLQVLNQVQIQKRILIVPFPRQNDQTSSPIFALEDLFDALKFWKEHPTESFIDTISGTQDLPPVDFHGTLLQQAPRFPARLLRRAQTLSKTAAFGREAFRTKDDLTSLRDYQQQNAYVFINTYPSCPKLIRRGNLGTEQKLCTYMADIIRHVIS